MPRIDFILWDRLFVLKLICTAQMTYSSFFTLVYFYLIILQSWTVPDGERKDVMKFKWTVLAVSLIDFGTGALLAIASNMRGIRSVCGIATWIVLETFIIPISIFFLLQLFYKLIYSKQQYSTDPHYSRVNIAQICFLLSQYLFIGYALDFLVSNKLKVRTYDPSIRPERVDAPTDPHITTTESRHIRLSQSFLVQQTSPQKFIQNTNSEESIASLNENEIKTEKTEKKAEVEDWKTDKINKIKKVMHRQKKI